MSSESSEQMSSTGGGDKGCSPGGEGSARDGLALPVLLLLSSHIASFPQGTASRLDEDGQSPWPPRAESGTEGAGSDAAVSLSSSSAWSPMLSAPNDEGGNDRFEF